MCLQTKRFVEMVKKYLQYKRLKETQGKFVTKKIIKNYKTERISQSYVVYLFVKITRKKNSIFYD